MKIKLIFVYILFYILNPYIWSINIDSNIKCPSLTFDDAKSKYELKDGFYSVLINDIGFIYHQVNDVLILRNPGTSTSGSNGYFHVEIDGKEYRYTCKRVTFQKQDREKPVTVLMFTNLDEAEGIKTFFIVKFVHLNIIYTGIRQGDKRIYQSLYLQQEKKTSEALNNTTIVVGAGNFFQMLMSEERAENSVIKIFKKHSSADSLLISVSNYGNNEIANDKLRWVGKDGGSLKEGKIFLYDGPKKISFLMVTPGISMLMMHNHKNPELAINHVGTLFPYDYSKDGVPSLYLVQEVINGFNTIKLYTYKDIMEFFIKIEKPQKASETNHPSLNIERGFDAQSHSQYHENGSNDVSGRTSLVNRDLNLAQSDIRESFPANSRGHDSSTNHLKIFDDPSGAENQSQERNSGEVLIGDVEDNNVAEGLISNVAGSLDRLSEGSSYKSSKSGNSKEPLVNMDLSNVQRPRANSEGRLSGGSSYKSSKSGDSKDPLVNMDLSNVQRPRANSEGRLSLNAKPSIEPGETISGDLLVQKERSAIHSSESMDSLKISEEESYKSGAGSEGGISNVNSMESSFDDSSSRINLEERLQENELLKQQQHKLDEESVSDIESSWKSSQSDLWLKVPVFPILKRSQNNVLPLMNMAINTNELSYRIIELHNELNQLLNSISDGEPDTNKLENIRKMFIYINNLSMFMFFDFAVFHGRYKQHIGYQFPFDNFVRYNKNPLLTSKLIYEIMVVKMYSILNSQVSLHKLFYKYLKQFSIFDEYMEDKHLVRGYETWHLELLNIYPSLLREYMLKINENYPKELVFEKKGQPDYLTQINSKSVRKENIVPFNSRLEFLNVYKLETILRNLKSQFKGLDIDKTEGSLPNLSQYFVKELPQLVSTEYKGFDGNTEVNYQLNL